MGYIAGVLVAIILLGLAALSGFSRDRSFHATLLMVVASYYVLFAAMAGSLSAMVVESAIATAFLLAAVAGFRRWHWLIVVGLAAHGVFDFVLHPLVTNPGMPAWWPAFCGTFDIAAAACIALLLSTRHRRA